MIADNGKGILGSCIFLHSFVHFPFDVLMTSLVGVKANNFWWILREDLWNALRKEKNLLSIADRRVFVQWTSTLSDKNTVRLQFKPDLKNNNLLSVHFYSQREHPGTCFKMRHTNKRWSVNQWLKWGELGRLSPLLPFEPPAIAWAPWLNL